MSKRSFGVLMIAVLAIAGLGLSGYMFVKYEILSPNDSPIKNIWYVENLGSTYFVQTTIEEIPDLNILAEANAGESLIILFNANAAVYVNGLEITRIQFKINGVVYADPFIEFGGTTSGNLYSPINLQYSLKNVSAGIYNISVCALSFDTGNWLKDMTLSVYSYL